MHPRTVSALCKALMWVVFGFSAVWQALTVVSIHLGNRNAVAAGQADKVFNLIPLIIACVLITAAVVLFSVLRNHRLIGFLLALFAGVIFLVVALDLGRAFPLQSGVVDHGLSVWDLIYRHLSVLLVPVLMLPAWLFERAAIKAEELQRVKEAAAPHVDLSGDPIFNDRAR